MENMSLVIFTVFAQCAAGLFAVTGLTQMRSNLDLRKGQVMALNQGYIISLVALAFAMVASSTHLGQPLRMFNVLYGLEHASPLSLEIVAVSTFGVVVFLLTALQLRSQKESVVGSWLLLLGIVLAIGLVQAIANVYTLPAVGAWDTPLTSMQFYQSALATGSSLAAMLFLRRNDSLGDLKDMARKVIGWSGLLAIVLLTVVTVMFLQRLVDLGIIYGMGDSAALTVYLHAGLVLAGLLWWVAPAIRGQDARFSAFIGFVLVIVGELLERIFFYDLLQAQVM